jgi:prepilin-type N-terminal cleavage/methylation domain
MNRLNKKGFTLVELLAILVILSIITLIAYPIIGNVINNSKSKLQKEQYNRIKSAAKNWATSNSIDETTGACIKISDLKSGGYLEDANIEDPKLGSSMNGSFKIEWVSAKNQYKYTYYVTTNCSGSNTPYTAYDS